MTEACFQSYESYRRSILFMETLGDAVVTGEAPHGDDLLRPGRKSLAKLDQLSQAGLAQLIDGTKQSGDQRLALFAGNDAFSGADGTVVA
ncbi:MAG: hypothetical protein ABI833_16915 [Acidobacteriota bacterium]